MSENTPGSDPIYKRLYAFPEMVADLLRSVLPAAVFDALDLSTLDKVPASYVGDDFRQRHGDAVWRVYAAGRWTYVLVLLEFQSLEAHEKSAARSREKRCCSFGSRTEKKPRTGRGSPLDIFSIFFQRAVSDPPAAASNSVVNPASGRSM